MTKDDPIWKDHYRANLEACVEIDMWGAEEMLKALPGSQFVESEDRAMRVRMLSSTMAGFEGEYGWSQNYGWPTTETGALSIMFLDFAAKNLPSGGGTVGRALRRDLIEAAIKSAAKHVLDLKILIKIATDNGVEPDEIDELRRVGEASFYDA